MCGGRGRCLAGSGVCSCFAGYVGDDCATCAADYVSVGGQCIFLPGASISCSDGVRNGNEEGVDCGGLNCSTVCPSPTVPLWMVVAVAVASAAILAIVVYVAMCTSTCTTCCTSSRCVPLSACYR